VFEATAPFEPFDYLRVPYRVSPQRNSDERVGIVRPVDADAGAPALLWVRAGRRAGGRSRRTIFEVGGCRVAGQVSAEHPARLLGDRDPSWHSRETVIDLAGRRIAEVWANDRGQVLLPFDPGEVMRCLWSEDYRRLGPRARVVTGARRTAVRGYYAVRPALPRAVQLALRQRLARTGPGPAFPAWPMETGLHDMYEWVLRLAAEVAGRPVPYIAAWPDGARWCMVLTHDVETDRGCSEIETLREPERHRGYRSSWNFVPERYGTPTGTLTALRADGCEVGVHGLKHDGRDLASARLLKSRLPAIRAAADRWGATGFRSPATQRHWSLMPTMGFDYDSSYTDSDPYEPQPGGCCSYLPFFIDDLVELPITLPQDHTLFSILGHQDATLWVEKAQRLRDRGGMVLVLSHPDYAHGAALGAWEALLEEFAGDETMWQPLAREAASWWRARAASRVVGTHGSWEIVGPAVGRGTVAEAGARVGGTA
jgi:hypothetical protein